MNKFSVVLYRDGVIDSVMSFGNTCRVTYSRSHAYALAKSIREDYNFSSFYVAVEDFAAL